MKLKGIICIYFFYLREKVNKYIWGLNKYVGKVLLFELFVNKKIF